METRTIGNLEVSVLGLGCNNFGGKLDAKATEAVVLSALDHGVTYFDTADAYGDSENVLGRALRGRRDEAVIATKFGSGSAVPEGEVAGSAAWVAKAADRSLRQLGVDVIDHYQMHKPDPTTPIVETLGALQELIDAGKVRDAMMAKGLSVLSVKRTYITIKAIINLAIAEHGLDIRNPFSSIFMPEEQPRKRVSIPVETIRSIQQACYTIDDDMRWLVALTSDTGMRLAEATGLLVDDLHLDSEIPYVDIKPQPWRSLKTRGSRRRVPLVGASLWAAQRIKQTTSSCFAFDRYTDNK